MSPGGWTAGRQEHLEQMELLAMMGTNQKYLTVQPSLADIRRNDDNAGYTLGVSHL